MPAAGNGTWGPAAPSASWRRQPLPPPCCAAAPTCASRCTRPALCRQSCRSPVIQQEPVLGGVGGWQAIVPACCDTGPTVCDSKMCNHVTQTAHPVLLRQLWPGFSDLRLGRCGPEASNVLSGGHLAPLPRLQHWQQISVDLRLPLKLAGGANDQKIPEANQCHRLAGKLLTHRCW